MISLRFAAGGLAVLAFGLGLKADVEVPHPAPPTKAQTADWMQHGRPLPRPEILQPTLDASLPAFEPRQPKTLAGHLHGAASDVLADLAQRWIAAFKQYYPEVQVEVPPPYSGKVGAKELVSDKVDFALVSRELVPSDVVDFKSKFGYLPTSVPIMGGSYRDFGFLDAIAFFVSKDNPIDHLSFKQLDAILSTSRHRGGEPVRTWGQLGLTGEWADKPINVWAVKPWNGFEEFVRERVLSTDGHRGEWRDDLNFVETVFPIAPHVSTDRYAIGYAGIAYINDGVKLISVRQDEDGPFVPPTYDEIAKASYPLSRLVYCNINQNPAKTVDPVLSEFIRFIVSREGQQVVLNQAVYLPLRAGQAATSLALLHP